MAFILYEAKLSLNDLCKFSTGGVFGAPNAPGEAFPEIVDDGDSRGVAAGVIDGVVRLVSEGDAVGVATGVRYIPDSSAIVRVSRMKCDHSTGCNCFRYSNKLTLVVSSSSRMISRRDNNIFSE